MKVKLISFLISLIFIPVAILGQFLGLYLGKLLYFIYEKVMFLNIPSFISDIAPAVISGAIAGYISALVISKTYKNFNFLFVLIIPIIVIIISLLGSFLNISNTGLSMQTITPFFRELITIGVFIYVLKEKSFVKIKL